MGNYRAPDPPPDAARRIDLHCHSDRSDGTEPPGEVMRRARAAGLDVVALTDHDTVAGWESAAAALPTGLTLVPGIEVSCGNGDVSVHLLAYLVDPEEAAGGELAAELRRIRDDRVRRARGMVERLAALGVPVTWEQVRRVAGTESGDRDASVGRPHIARAMVEAGAIGSIAEAFTPAWIASGGRAYVPRYAPHPARAVRLVRRAGGVSVLAHPYGERDARLDRDTIGALAREGLDGVEVDHPDQGPAERESLRTLAADLRLVVTGSSDDHGRLTGHRLGCETTAPEAYGTLIARATGAVPIVAVQSRPGAT